MLKRILCWFGQTYIYLKIFKSTSYNWGSKLSDSFKDKEKIRENKWETIKSIVISIIVAIAMWYIVSVQDRIEAQVDLNVDYMKIPPNLVITKGLIPKVTVRLKGPEKLIRSIPRDNVVHTVNLSGIKKGANKVPITMDVLGPVFRAFDIVDISPAEIELIADNIVERSVRIKLLFDSPLLGNALTVEEGNVFPSNVILRGPEETISKMSELPLVVKVDPKEVGINEVKNMLLNTPSFVSADPPSVRVKYIVTSGREKINRYYRIDIVGDNSSQYEISPKDLFLELEVPEALTKDSKYLKQLRVTVVPPDMAPGQTVKLKPQITNVPDGMGYEYPPNTEIYVTKIR